MQVIVAGTIDLAVDAGPVIASAQELIAAALVERGCHAYEWAVDPAKPKRILVLERWERVEDLLAHLNDDPYFDMAGHLNEAGITDAGVACYSVAGTEPIYGEDGNIRKEIFGVRHEAAS